MTWQVMEYGNMDTRMCHRWKNKTWGKWLRARPFVVYDAIVQQLTEGSTIAFAKEKKN